VPFLAFRASEHSQSLRTAALGGDECNGKSGDGKLPASESSACAACNIPCILAHYKYALLWCAGRVRSMVHEGARPNR
jgi:hypothetical protein